MTKLAFIQAVRSAGSSATTFAGAFRFARMPGNMARVFPPGYRQLDAHGWKLQEEVRKKYPEAKRARDDTEYRRNFLSRLNREQKRLLYPSLDTVEAVVKARLSETAADLRLAEIGKYRFIATGRRRAAAKFKFAPPANAAILQCTDYKKAGFIPPTAGRKWDVTDGYANICLADQDNESAKGSHGFYTVTSADHRAEFCCFGMQYHDYAKFCVGNKTIVLKIPGVLWSNDANGIYAHIGPDDYHPSALDVLRKDCAAFIVQRITTNAERRRQVAAEIAVEKADMEGVWVCARDSIEAGNCVPGTQSFVSRHALDIRRHYSAYELLLMGNGDTQRVRLAIRCAVNRHRSEMQRGYADLSRHTL